MTDNDADTGENWDDLTQEEIVSRLEEAEENLDAASVYLDGQHTSALAASLADSTNNLKRGIRTGELDGAEDDA